MAFFKIQIEGIQKPKYVIEEDDLDLAFNIVKNIVKVSEVIEISETFVLYKTNNGDLCKLIKIPSWNPTFTLKNKKEGPIVEEYPISDLENYKNHHRLKVFYHKGLQCKASECKEKAAHLVNRLTRSEIPNLWHCHIDLFSESGILMTIDHVIPKSKGGAKTSLKNLVPMCSKCNGKKGDSLPHNHK